MKVTIDITDKNAIEKILKYSELTKNTVEDYLVMIITNSFDDKNSVLEGRTIWNNDNN